jgi:putative methionine-R-sulfoxide reductase with GAF domain
MFEFSARILLAGGIVFAASFGLFDFDLAWKAAAALGALGIFGHRLEARGMRNPGIAGFFAVADAFVVSWLLGAAGALEGLGFLVLAPCVWAAARHRARPLHMAPLASASLLATHALQSGLAMPPKLLLAQAAAILLVGLILPQTPEKNEEPAPQPMSLAQPVENALLELREKYRQLREAYQDLDRRSRRDRISARLHEAREGSRATFYTRVAAKVAELTGARGLVLYTVAQFAETMVVRSTSGTVDDAVADMSLPIDLKRGIAFVEDSTEKMLACVRPESGARWRNIVLGHEGRVVGMLSMSHDDPDALDEAVRTAEEIAPAAAAILADEARRERFERRVREAELMYDLGVLCHGAGSRPDLAARVVRELAELLRLDHAAVYLLDGDGSILLSQQGARVRLIDQMSFAKGGGVAGWRAIGAPELLLFDVRADSRCPAKEALRARVGSYAVVPLSVGDDPVGFLSAATHRTGGIDLRDAEALRIAAAELGQALARIEAPAAEAEGVMTPGEFQRHVAGREGCLVHLEPMRRLDLIEAFGAPALNHALRTFVRRLRARLPVGGAICRRAEGDYVVYLPGSDEGAASRWANEVAALGAMIGLRTPDGAASIPLALRARVARWAPQNDGFLAEQTA